MFNMLQVAEGVEMPFGQGCSLVERTEYLRTEAFMICVISRINNINDELH